MESAFVAMAGGWPVHAMSGVPPPSRPYTHSRSASNVVRSSTPKMFQDDQSNMDATTLANLTSSKRSSPLSRQIIPRRSFDDHDLSTIPDPRSRAMSPSQGDSSSSPQHPDLDDEVATLSAKLINAINHQTNLDDTLSATRADLDNAHAKIQQLEAQLETQREMLAGDVWVRRGTVEAEKSQLRKRIVDEKAARQDMEQQKKKIEQELENLTAALFEEANKMVITAKEDAKLEQEILQRKNDQLKAQLEDNDVLLKSQQEQLAELKQVMEQMSIERDDQTNPTIPSSPGFSKFDNRDEDGQSDGASHPGLLEPLSPSYPTSFSHLLQPVLRTDLHSFNDFRDLVRTSKRLSGRVGGSVGIFGQGSMASNMSNASVSTAGTPANTSPNTPNTLASGLGSGVAATSLVLPPLKDTKFYKRALAEDIEPTLRLDTAPGLSWLARRTVLSAMTDGSLVVEPVPTTAAWSKLAKPELYPCSLCGESRKEEEHLRRHRFRTSESTTAQRYPLCKYCLTRVRSTCDFLGFLRMIKDGHWRADDDDAEKAAWEESVRLREQMFWSRIGGGVVPVSHGHASTSFGAASIGGDKSPRPSQDDQEEASMQALEATHPPTMDEVLERATPIVGIPVSTTPTADVSTSAAPEPATQPEGTPAVSAMAIESSVQDEQRVSVEPSDLVSTEAEDHKRLSIKIPAATPTA